MRFIDASKYIEYLSELMVSAKKYNKFDEAAGLQREINRISNFTTADVAPVVHGEWIITPYEAGFHVAKCSSCGIERIKVSLNRIEKFCPNCGTKMDGGKNDEV